VGYLLGHVYIYSNILLMELYSNILLAEYLDMYSLLEIFLPVPWIHYMNESILD